MAILLNNRLLQVAEQKVESGLTPENRENYMRIVVAGMRVALDKGPNGIMASLRKSRDPVSDAAIGAVNLVLLMRKQSRDTMPPAAIPPATMTLMLQALDFCEKARITKITAKKLDRATLIYRNHILAAFGVTPQNLAQAGAKVHGIMQDPAQMDILARRVGVVKDPRASVPTNLPPAGGTNGV